MKLQCIFDVEKDESLQNRYLEIYKKVKEKYGHEKYPTFDVNELFENYKCISSYARCTHVGTIKDGIELSELELSMVCDYGFSHFGGLSVIRDDRTFEVVIYTD
jgi:hypothetical protein